ncbi:MAG: hypothetical protein ACOCZB_02130 [Spirochaetota bacterium]
MHQAIPSVRLSRWRWSFRQKLDPTTVDEKLLLDIISFGEPENPLVADFERFTVVPFAHPADLACP